MVAKTKKSKDVEEKEQKHICVRSTEGQKDEKTECKTKSFKLEGSHCKLEIKKIWKKK